MQYKLSDLEAKKCQKSENFGSPKVKFDFFLCFGRFLSLSSQSVLFNETFIDIVTPLHVCYNIFKTGFLKVGKTSTANQNAARDLCWKLLEKPLTILV
jgi:hypothetical protein